MEKYLKKHLFYEDQNKAINCVNLYAKINSTLFENLKEKGKVRIRHESTYILEFDNKAYSIILNPNGGKHLICKIDIPKGYRDAKKR